MKGNCGSMADLFQEQGGSSGHKLGQLVGDWFQDYFVMPVLSEIAEKLGLYLDHRQRKREGGPAVFVGKMKMAMRLTMTS